MGGNRKARTAGSWLLQISPCSEDWFLLPCAFLPIAKFGAWSLSLTNQFLICRLACSAFEAVFQKRQTKFGDLLAWLARVKEGKALRAQAAGLRGVVEKYHR